MNLRSNSPTALNLTLITALACSLAFFLHVLLFSFTESKAIIYNPFLSGFLHQDFEHLGLNMLVLFVCSLHPINQQIGFNRLFFINTIISSIYYPLVVLDIMPFAIGLSGTCNFFLCRAMLHSKPIFKWVLAGIIAFELAHIFEVNHTAHLVHLIGLIMGGLSVSCKNLNINVWDKSELIP